MSFYERSKVRGLTVLQGSDSLALLAVLAVTNVVSCLHPELVGGERLESEAG